VWIYPIDSGHGAFEFDRFAAVEFRRKGMMKQQHKYQ
jgi:hypothetical protein